MTRSRRRAQSPDKLGQHQKAEIKAKSRKHPRDSDEEDESPRRLTCQRNVPCEKSTTTISPRPKKLLRSRNRHNKAADKPVAAPSNPPTTRSLCRRPQPPATELPPGVAPNHERCNSPGAQKFLDTGNYRLQPKLLQYNSPPPSPSRDPRKQYLKCREPMPELGKLLLKPLPEEFKAPNNQVWLAGMMQVDKMLHEGSIEKTPATTPKIWCHCWSGEVRSGSIECEDRACTYLNWYHWDCLSELERALAKTWSKSTLQMILPASNLDRLTAADFWLCRGCWSRRAVQFFQENPQHWINGVADLDDIPDHESLVKDIHAKVDPQILLDFLPCDDQVFEAARERDERKKGLPKSAAQTPIARFSIRKPRQWSAISSSGSSVSAGSVHSIHDEASEAAPGRHIADDSLWLEAEDEIEGEVTEQLGQVAMAHEERTPCISKLGGSLMPTEYASPNRALEILNWIREATKEDEDTILPSIELTSTADDLPFTAVHEEHLAADPLLQPSRSASRLWSPSPSSQGLPENTPIPELPLAIAQSPLERPAHFASPGDSVPDPQQSEINVAAHPSPASSAFSTAEHDPPSGQEADSESLPSVFHSVFDQEGLHNSAQCWTNESSKVVVTVDSSSSPSRVSLQYKHRETVARYVTTKLRNLSWSGSN